MASLHGTKGLFTVLYFVYWYYAANVKFVFITLFKSQWKEMFPFEFCDIFSSGFCFILLRFVHFYCVLINGRQPLRQLNFVCKCEYPFGHATWYYLIQHHSRRIIRKGTQRIEVFCRCTSNLHMTMIPIFFPHFLFHWGMCLSRQTSTLLSIQINCKRII